MNVLEYTKNVKTFKEADIKSALLNITVSNNDLRDNIQRIVNELDLSKEIGEWVITKGITKYLASKGLNGKSFVQDILAASATIDKLVPELTKVVTGFKEQVWDGKLINLRQANLLNLIEHLNFWLSYTRTVFEVLVSIHGTRQDPMSTLDKADTRWINGTEQFYRLFFAELLEGANSIIVGLGNVPEVEVSQTTLDVLEATESESTSDLLKQGFGIHLVNPVFWVGMLWKDINLKRIDQMRRKNEMFAMKITQAINLKNGSDDPKLDHRIEVYQNEIIKNQAAIERIEASYA